VLTPDDFATFRKARCWCAHHESNLDALVLQRGGGRDRKWRTTLARRGDRARDGDSRVMSVERIADAAAQRAAVRVDGAAGRVELLAL